MSSAAVSTEHGEPALSPTEAFDFPLVHRTGYLLLKAGTLLLQEAERALEAHGMRMRYFYVLAALEDDRALSQQDLSRLLNLDPTTMVTLVDEMETSGHVERHRNPADRRRYILRLTTEGRTALATASQVVDEVEGRFLAAVPEAESEQLHGILSELLTEHWPRVVACE